MSSPTDYYLLRVAFGGLSGPLSNIDQEGFAAASFHSWEDTLKWDGYSGDYGPNFVGLSLNQGTYIVQHPEFGWQAFGGIITQTSPTVIVQARDAVRRRVFIAPMASLLTLDAGTFSQVEFDPLHKSVRVTVVAGTGSTAGAAAKASVGRLVVTQTVQGVDTLKPASTLAVDGGAYSIPFSNGVATVSLVPS
jgi:hypothetical protein